jgi:hypothetical protein
MTSMIFSFDTEDFVTPESDDALLGLARILTQHGLRGSFALVGDKVRALLARGRRDVIDACREHDIQYHSNNHMFHDMHNVKVRGVVPPKAEWRPPPFVGPAELRRRLAVFAGLVEFVGSRRDMEVITISDYLARHEEGLCWLSAAEVTALAQAIRRDFSYQEHSGGYLSAADVAGVLSHGLTHWREHHRLPGSDAGPPHCRAARAGVGAGGGPIGDRKRAGHGLSADRIGDRGPLAAAQRHRRGATGSGTRAARHVPHGHGRCRAAACRG